MLDAYQNDVNSHQRSNATGVQNFCKRQHTVATMPVVRLQTAMARLIAASGSFFKLSCVNVTTRMIAKTTKFITAGRPKPEL